MAAGPSLAHPLASYTAHAGIRSHQALFARYLVGQWRRFTLAALLLLAGIALQLLAPQVLRIFIDTAQASEKVFCNLLRLSVLSS
jgi:ABC-type multidrug transport system fused ATPase/permease subunit